MSFSYSEIFAHMGIPAIVIASVLLLMGLASLTVCLERTFTLRRSRRESRAFAAAMADLAADEGALGRSAGELADQIEDWEERRIERERRPRDLERRDRVA